MGKAVRQGQGESAKVPEGFAAPGNRAQSGPPPRGPGSHPGAQPLFSVRALVAGPGGAAGAGAPGGRRQQRAEAPGQAGAGGRGERQQRRQSQEAEHDERRRAAVRQQRAAPGAWRGVHLRARRGQRGPRRKCVPGAGIRRPAPSASLVSTVDKQGHLPTAQLVTPSPGRGLRGELPSRFQPQPHRPWWPLVRGAGATLERYKQKPCLGRGVRQAGGSQGPRPKAHP